MTVTVSAARRRLRVALLLVLLPVAVAFGLVGTSTPHAQALSGADFRAGNIIADSVFFNADTMSASNIQSFLQARVPTCKGGTCLRDYYQDTWTRGSDAQCGTYQGAAGERASTIIDKVAKACGVNPMVLLVLLQKESSLVTSTSPSSTNYRIATGYGCPDTAPCDQQYFGFYNQVYKAAWQYKRYTNNPTSYSYQAGRNNYVQWHPNAACGGSTVYIANKATAALYIYTPYAPNSAALNNLYGTGDGCSSYGNRNFWRIFTDWFGSTQVSFSVGGAIGATYDSMGGSSGALGDAVSNEYPTAGGGRTQAFENGRIHWSPATGASAVLAPISPAYDALLGESGPLGYPTGARYSTFGGGWTQGFQNGRIHWSPTTGAHAVLAPISPAYDAQLGESGPLGYPTGDRYGTFGGGWTQGFQNGRIHWSPATGAYAVLAPISPAYDALLGESGPLGYPTGSRYGTLGGGWTQGFQNGRIHWSPATGAHAVRGVVQPAYDALGGESGPLGYPVGEQYATAGGGTTQGFQRGRIHASPGTGAHAVIGELSTAYDAVLGESGPLGYPTGDRYATRDDGWTQAFQQGRLHWSSASGAHAVTGAMSTVYDARGGESGALGYPVGDQYATSSGGVAQAFQQGTVVLSTSGSVQTVVGGLGFKYAALGGAAGPLGEPLAAETPSAGGGTAQVFRNGRIVDGPDSGAHALLAPVLAAYDALGAPAANPLGWPMAEQYTTATGSTVQRFQRGELAVTRTGSFAVLGDIATRWATSGRSGGDLGDPVAAQVTLLSGGSVQAFAGGLVLSTPQTGTQVVLGDLASAYTAAGREGGALGLPVGDRYATPRGGWTQPFQNGRIHWSPGTGAFPVTGPLSAAYDALTGEAGVLGYPTAAGTMAGGVGSQTFERGVLVVSASGARTVLDPVAAGYAAAGGAFGPLGLPTGDRYATTGNGWTQPFQNGRIHYSPDTGAHTVLKPISPAYDALAGESGALGYPTGDRYATTGNGWTQPFQNGRIHYSPETGAHTVLKPISPAYDALAGESGALGYPTGDRYATTGNGWTQPFQNGRIHYSPETGAHAVLKPISPAYDALAGESGALGYPTGDRTVGADRTVTQAFQHGTITVQPDGTVTVTAR